MCNGFVMRINYLLSNFIRCSYDIKIQTGNKLLHEILWLCVV